jgi:hypothetical protein
VATIDLTDSRFAGRSRSFTAQPRQKGTWARCKRCSSTLYPQRLESRKLRVIGGTNMAVDKYRTRASTAVLIRGRRDADGALLGRRVRQAGAVALLVRDALQGPDLS